MGKSDTASTTNEPWEGQIPYLNDLFRQGQDMSSYEPTYYQGPYQASRSAQSVEGEQAGLDLIRGEGGSGGAASGYLNDVLSGQYMDRDSNPWLQERFDRGADDISRHYMRAVSPGLSMEAMGRGGSGRESNLSTRAQETLGDRLGSWEADLFGGHYADERGRMGQAAGMAPSVDASRRADIGFGYGTGERREAYDQRPYDEAMRQHQFEQNIPYKQLESYAKSLGPAITGNQTSTQSQGFGGAEAAGLGIGLLGLLACSREYKDPQCSVDAEAVLIQLLQLPIDVWQYKPEFAEEHKLNTSDHLGPYAEDVTELFQLGNSKQIDLYSLVGISLSSIQAMALRAATQDERIEALEKRLVELGGDDGAS
jgi:hypothetical protein